MGLIMEAAAELLGHGVKVVREPNRFSFGNREECRKLFEELFVTVDKSVDKFQNLPEYEMIMQWMMDTKGTGLAFVGDCGRGKSTILTGVIPMLYYMKERKILRPFQAFEIPDKVKDIMGRWAIVIDEVGTEVQCNEWGEKYEGFNRIMDHAEANLKQVFISTNLTKDQIITRYGTRTWERMNRLCRVVKFKGDSLR